MRRSPPLPVALIGLATLLLPLAAAGQDLEVHFIDVGQADATLIVCPDDVRHVLIDAGDTRYPGSAEAFQAYLTRHFADRPDRIQLAVASHPHADHIGSMQWVLENFDVVRYVDNGQQAETALFGRLQKERRRQTNAGQLSYFNGKVDTWTEFDPCHDDDVTVEIIAPWAIQNLSDTNDRSVLVRIQYRDVSFLFTGDAHDHAEDVLRTGTDDDTRAKLDVDVLKVGHHGSDTSSTAEFVNLVQPMLVVISAGEPRVGTNARYKHPRLSTLLTYRDWFAVRDASAHPMDGFVDAYDKAEEQWRRHKRREGLWLTPRDGTLVVRSDGTGIEIEPEFD